MKRTIPLLIVVVVLVVLLYAGLQLRSELDFQTSMGSMAEIQASLQSLRTAVIRLGWIAPLAFILMVTFRYFLLLSSGLVLTVGGLVFGAVQGTLLGFIGILSSSLFHFYVGRYGGRDLVVRFFGDKLDKYKEQIETAGPWVVGACVAHPAGSMGIIQTAAGLSTIPLLKLLSWLLCLLGGNHCRNGTVGNGVGRRHHCCVGSPACTSPGRTGEAIWQEIFFAAPS
jgi:uncharacterized membrane protein YdjX (TVP38/TMEM64 family)